MYRLTLTLDQVPKTLNKALRTHRFASNRTNKAWDTLVFFHVRNKLPPAPLKKAHIRLVRHAWRTLDYDGLVGSMKPVVDALVTCGVLSDDSWNVLGVWDVDQQFRPKKDGQRLEIEVMEYTDA